MTPEQIAQGLNDLGLGDPQVRRSLQHLAHLVPRPPEATYQTATVANTNAGI